MTQTAVSAPRHLGLGRLLGINAFWFGGGAHWQPISISLLPLGAVLVTRNSSDAELLVGHATAAGGIFAMLVPILAGWLSDRTSSRWGRRRPWMVAGTLFNLLGVLLLAIATSPFLVIVSYLAVQVSNNAAGAAYSGVIPDVVPAPDRGRASGLLGTMNQAGTVVGVGLVAAALLVLGKTRAGVVGGYGIVALLVTASLLISIVAIVEQPAAAPPPSHRSLRQSLSPTVLVCAGAFGVATLGLLSILVFSLGDATLPVAALAVAGAIVCFAYGRRLPGLRAFLSPFGDHDFFWVFFTRFLTTLGIYSILPFIAFYFRDVIEAPNFAAASALWLLAVIGSAVVPSIVCGYLSDRWRRRKIFVYVSSGLQALVVSVLLFGLIRSLAVMYILGILYGVGYGAYYAVDWALACDVLPDRDAAAGKDMGLWHTSFTLPQVAAPAVLALVLVYLNQPGHVVIGLTTGDNLGYRALFACAALFSILGTVMVSRIRAVR